MAGSFLIFFRESLEATMILSVMFAYLKQIGRTDRFKDVWIGVIAALGVASLSGVIIYSTLRYYDGTRIQSIIESFTYLIAAIVLTSMTFWMNRQGKTIKKDLHAKISAALASGATLTLTLTAFVTVGREGLETVIFLLAIIFTSNPLWVAAGAIVGLAFGLTLSYFIYIAGKKIPLRNFFQGMGTLLMLFAAGLISDTIQDFQQLGWINFGKTPLWDTSRWLSENGTLGDILHSFFGYADNPTVLQASLYVLYLSVMLYWFWRKPAQKMPA